MLDGQADLVLQRVSEGYYWEEGQLQTRTILIEAVEFVETIAKIYNPQSEKPILETNLEELLKSVNRVSLPAIHHLLHLLLRRGPA